MLVLSYEITRTICLYSISDNVFRHLGDKIDKVFIQSRSIPNKNCSMFEHQRQRIHFGNTSYWCEDRPASNDSLGAWNSYLRPRLSSSCQSYVRDWRPFLRIPTSFLAHGKSNRTQIQRYRRRTLSKISQRNCKPCRTHTPRPPKQTTKWVFMEYWIEWADEDYHQTSLTSETRHAYRVSQSIAHKRSRTGKKSMQIGRAHMEVFNLIDYHGRTSSHGMLDQRHQVAKGTVSKSYSRSSHLQVRVHLFIPTTSSSS